MYYEIHGDGRPLVLLHGAYMTTGMFGGVLPGLAATRQVIAAEQQGHGHMRLSGLDLSAPRTDAGARM
jgi:pimeloyl-ACP methyl ester carboxylesterase